MSKFVLRPISYDRDKEAEPTLATKLERVGDVYRDRRLLFVEMAAVTLASAALTVFALTAAFRLAVSLF